MLAERPSLEVPLPRMTAYTRSPSRSASARRLSTTMPVPSPISTPSASASNGRISPFRLNACNWLNTDQKLMSCTWCTPPASTASSRPLASSVIPWSTAISEDAQAASIVYAGPRRFSRFATRDAARLGTRPIVPSG
jgi:hypothetical protein